MSSSHVISVLPNYNPKCGYNPLKPNNITTPQDLYSVPSTSVSAQQHPGGLGLDNSEHDDGSDLDVELTTSQERGCEHSDAPNETAARARKNLQRDLENKLAEGGQHFLKAFGGIDQKLNDLQNNIVTEIRRHCDEAETQLRLTEEASRSLLDQAESLRHERQEVENRKFIMMLFLDRFILSDNGVEAITPREVPVGSRFFAAMCDTERIHEGCRVLMSGEDGPTRAGLDIMATTSSYLERGYEKIYRLGTFEFRRIGGENQLEVSPVMAETIRRLSQPPELLSEALTFLSDARQSTLLALFLDALTRGGPSGLPWPIELHAHDDQLRGEGSRKAEATVSTHAVWELVQFFGFTKPVFFTDIEVYTLELELFAREA
ncbi:COG6-domain-containing protein [Paxillus ammoniavirescens]|nr:COG6-domain-containing protein [Paxillus ammoniavirescens]